MAKWPQSGHILALRDLFLLFDRHLKVAGMVEGQRHEYFEITRISTRRDHIRNRHAQFVTKKETIWSVKRSRRGKHRGFFSDLSIRLEIRALALDVASEALQRRPPRITQRTLRLRVLYVCLDPYRALIGSYSDTRNAVTTAARSRWIDDVRLPARRKDIHSPKLRRSPPPA